MDPRLFEAACTGDIAAFHSLLSDDPLILDRVSLKSVENPLHISSLAGHADFAKEIAGRKPAFARELNEDGFSPMHIASANGHIEIVRELLRFGNDICLVKGKDGKTPLHCAAMKGRIDIVKELVSACPESVKEVTIRGETALHLSVKNNQFEVFRVLMEELKKLDMMEHVNWKDKEGNTILHLATLRKQNESIGLLIGQGAIASRVDVNSMNSNGFTPKDVLDIILQSGSESFDINTIEMFQRVGAMKAKEIATTKPTHRQVKENNLNGITPTSPPSRPWNLWKELTKEIEESSMDTQNALMVVAVLIATMAYQAILSPPSGFWSADSGRNAIGTIQRRQIVPGEAVMAGDPHVFAIFTVFNALGFFASLAMISLLTNGFPLRAGLRLAILSMTATYVIAVFYMAPTHMKTVFVVVSLMGVIVLVDFARFVLWLMEKWGIRPCRRGRRGLPSGNLLRV